MVMSLLQILASILNLDIKNRGITNLTGIEDFSALKNLDCSGNLLINIDVRPFQTFRFYGVLKIK